MLDVIIGLAVLAAGTGWVAALVRPVTARRAAGWLRRRRLEATAPALATVGEYLDRARRHRIRLLTASAAVLLVLALTTAAVSLPSVLLWAAAVLLAVPVVAGVAGARGMARHPGAAGRRLVPAWLLHAGRAMAALDVGGALGGLAVASRESCTLAGQQPLWMVLSAPAAVAAGGAAAAGRWGGRADPVGASTPERAVVRSGARAAMGVALAAAALGLRAVAGSLHELLAGCPAAAVPDGLLTGLQRGGTILAVLAATAVAALTLLPARAPAGRHSVNRATAKPADPSRGHRKQRRGQHRHRDPGAHVRDRVTQERGADPLAHVGERVE